MRVSVVSTVGGVNGDGEFFFPVSRRVSRRAVQRLRRRDADRLSTIKGKREEKLAAP